MDRFQFRGQRPAASSPARQPQAQQQETFTEMADATANRSGVTGKLLVLSLIVVSVAVTAFVAFAIFRGLGGSDIVKKDQYQAVFLTDGQVYFGKLGNLQSEYATLEDIYYLQVEQQVQPKRDAKTESPQISLAKLGQELHGPEDKMQINKDLILFWENLKNDGQVAKAIAEYKATGGKPATTNTNSTTNIEAAED